MTSLRPVLLLWVLPVAAGVLSAAGSVLDWPYPEVPLRLLAWPGTVLEQGTTALAERGGLALTLLLLLAVVMAGVASLHPRARAAVPVWPTIVIPVAAFALGARLFMSHGATLAVLLLLVLGAATALAAMLRSDPVERGRVEPTVAWDGVSALALCLAATALFAGIDRDAASRFISHWQCWGCLSEMGWQPAELARLTTGTARCSLESGPYRALVLTAFALAGASFTVMRAISAACALAAVLLLHRSLRARFAPGGAACGAALFASAPAVLDYGHVASYLGPSLLRATLTVLAYVRWMGSAGERGGVALGLVLLADLYGFAPLRFALAMLPVVTALVAWQQVRGGRLRSSRLIAPFLVLLAPLAVVLLLTRADPASLIYVDGEFMPTQALASDERFRVMDPTGLAPVPRAALEVLVTVFAAWPRSDHVDDGASPILGTAHVLVVLLGLVGLAWRRGWPPGVPVLLGVLVVAQLAVLGFVMPPVPRRMVLLAPLLLVIGVGAFELVAAWTGPRRYGAWVGVVAVLLLFASGLAGVPGLGRSATAEDRAAEPDTYLREIADHALQRGYRMLLVGPELGDLPPSEWTTGRAGILEGSWGFYHWRDCVHRGGEGAVGMIPSDGPLSGVELEGDIGGFEIGAVGEDAPLLWFADSMWLGDEQRVLFVDPVSEVGGGLLSRWEAVDAVVYCDPASGP